LEGKITWVTLQKVWVRNGEGSREKRWEGEKKKRKTLIYKKKKKAPPDIGLVVKQEGKFHSTVGFHGVQTFAFCVYVDGKTVQKKRKEKNRRKTTGRELEPKIKKISIPTSWEARC
jgi:hypothetical protein